MTGNPDHPDTPKTPKKPLSETEDPEDERLEKLKITDPKAYALEKFALAHGKAIGMENGFADNSTVCDSRGNCMLVDELLLCISKRSYIRGLEDDNPCSPWYKNKHLLYEPMELKKPTKKTEDKDAIKLKAANDAELTRKAIEAIEAEDRKNKEEPTRLQRIEDMKKRLTKEKKADEFNRKNYRYEEPPQTEDTDDEPTPNIYGARMSKKDQKK
jgi:hypothetical protein